MVMGLLPFEYWAMVALKDSLRAALDMKLFEAAPFQFEDMSAAPVAAFWRAEVRLEACCPGGDLDVCLADRSMGMARPSMVTLCWLLL